MCVSVCVLGERGKGTWSEVEWAAGKGRARDQGVARTARCAAPLRPAASRRATVQPPRKSQRRRAAARKAHARTCARGSSCMRRHRGQADLRPRRAVPLAQERVMLALEQLRHDGERLGGRRRGSESAPQFDHRLGSDARYSRQIADVFDTVRTFKTEPAEERE